MSALTLGLVALGPVCGEEEPSPEQALDELVAKAGVGPHSPGVGGLVVDAHGVRLKRAYGLANRAAKTPILTSTTFELASGSKHVAGSAVLLLVQRGKVRVTDDVRKHLPGLPAYDAEHPITVDHLSRHTSGLPDYLSWEGAEPATGYLTNADAVAEFARRKDSSPLVSVPGEAYDDGNSGYGLLGALVERVSGQGFGAFRAKEFFAPLAMKTAWVHESPAVPKAATAIGHTREGEAGTATWAAPTKEKHEKLFTTGDGSVWASLDDMQGWVAGLRAGNPVKTETLTAALAPGTTRSGAQVAYAMGRNVEYDDQGAVAAMYHTGVWCGFQNYVHHGVDHDRTIVVLSNRSDFAPAHLARTLGELFPE